MGTDCLGLPVRCSAFLIINQMLAENLIDVDACVHNVTRQNNTIRASRGECREAEPFVS